MDVWGLVHDDWRDFFRRGLQNWPRRRDDCDFALPFADVHLHHGNLRRHSSRALTRDRCRIPLMDYCEAPSSCRSTVKQEIRTFALNLSCGLLDCRHLASLSINTAPIGSNFQNKLSWGMQGYTLMRCAFPAHSEQRWPQECLSGWPRWRASSVARFRVSRISV